MSPNYIAVDTASVYWTTIDTVMKVALGGGAPSPVASGQFGPAGIAVDAASVYWANSTYPGGTVVKVALGGGALTTLAPSENIPTGVTVDATSVYWTTRGTPPSFSDGAVATVPLGGGTITTLASGMQIGQGSIIVNATGVYWTTSSNIMKTPLGGGTPPAVVATGQPWDIAMDAASLYWTDPIAGTVTKMPLGGSTLTTLASGQNGPGGIAVDAASVYWTDSGGTVMKVTPK